MNYFSIICNFFISVYPVNPGSCARGLVIAGELGDIRVLPFPQVLQPIIHYDFRQGKQGMASITFLCFISFIPIYFFQSAVEVTDYYLVFISLSFVFYVSL